MKKIIVTQDFEYHGESYNVDDVVELVDHVADKLCNRGKGKAYYEAEEDTYTPQPKRKKRRTKKKE